MKEIKIGWNVTFAVPDSMVPAVVAMLGEIYQVDGDKLKEVEFSVGKGQDYEHLARLNIAREEMKGTLGKEVEQYRKYWLDTTSERDNFKKEKASLEKRLSDIENAMKPDDNQINEAKSWDNSSWPV